MVVQLRLPFTTRTTIGWIRMYPFTGAAMKRIGLALAGLCGLCLLIGAGAQEMLHFPLHRFSIAPLEAPAAEGTNSILLTMSLPASGGFAPNVNVITQASPGSIDDYIAASKGGFQQAGLRVTKFQKLGQDAVVFEYAGRLQNRPLHFYAKAVVKDGQVLFATATATEQEWPSVSAQLQACVDSFRRD
jgi:hypothetical protein